MEIIVGIHQLISNINLLLQESLIILILEISCNNLGLSCVVGLFRSVLLATFFPYYTIRAMKLACQNVELGLWPGGT